MSMMHGGGPASPPLRVPGSGSFATSEVLPMMQEASAQLHARRDEWKRARDAAAEAKAHAKKTRADLIVQLRVWGAEETGNVPIKTSAERQEWANADANVQQAELEADLAQTVAMAAGAALDQAQEQFGALRSMLGIERDEMQAERGAPQIGP